MTHKHIISVGSGDLPQGYDLYLLTGIVNLWTPSGPLDQDDVLLKSVDLTGSVTVKTIGGATFDNDAIKFAIHLAGHDPGAYPYSSSGGDAVRLIYDFVTNSWYVVSASGPM